MCGRLACTVPLIKTGAYGCMQQHRDTSGQVKLANMMQAVTLQCTDHDLQSHDRGQPALLHTSKVEACEVDTRHLPIGAHDIQPVPCRGARRPAMLPLRCRNAELCCIAAVAQKIQEQVRYVCCRCWSRGTLIIACMQATCTL